MNTENSQKLELVKEGLWDVFGKDDFITCLVLRECEDPKKLEEYHKIFIKRDIRRENTITEIITEILATS